MRRRCRAFDRGLDTRPVGALGELGGDEPVKLRVYGLGDQLL
jgi:hypothetical protein